MLLKRILIGQVFVLISLSLASSVFPQGTQRSPTQTVSEFYKTLRERKFKEAFSMSIYRAAVDPLSPKELEDLRPDFERMAAAIPEKLELTGETISGDMATVFVKTKEGETAEKSEPITLIQVNGAWLIGDKENEVIVKKAGKNFFFNARIDTHHNEVQDLLTRIMVAEVAYNQQHNGKYANLAELITAGMVPKDLEGTETTGYRFQVISATDGKSWYATAEPAQYGRTGKLSFYLDATGVKSSDVGGKPLILKN